MVLLLKMLYIIFWNVLHTWTKEEHFWVIATISISILKLCSLGTISIVMTNFYKSIKKILGLMSAIFHFFTFSLVLLTFFQCQNFKCLLSVFWFAVINSQGRIQRGAHLARAPPTIGKNMIFWRKIVIFHTKYPKNVRASLRNWKK